MAGVRERSLVHSTKFEGKDIIKKIWQKLNDVENSAAIRQNLIQRTKVE